MKQPLLLMVHGWGFGPGFWRPLSALLGPERCRLVDLGFSGRMQLPIDPHEPFIGIGHSMGFLWLLRQLRASESAAEPTLTPANCLGLVSINGFSRFSRSRDFKAGISPRIIKQMQSRLSHDPQGVLGDFRQQSGLPPITRGMGLGGLQVGPLQAGLDGLANWDERERFNQWSGPWLGLAGQDDAIVPPALTRQSFGAQSPSKLIWSQSGGHLLPLTRTAWCGEQLSGFLAGIQGEGRE
ncbi:MAG: alpha/beta hydrolase [Magnetococcales bacterium]|nr:alpha/beta hydrolase [Magnetococcales bacterium]